VIEGKTAGKMTSLAIVLFLTAITVPTAQAAPEISLSLGEDGNLAPALQVVALLTVLSLVPAIMLMFTCFTRIVVVLSFVRMAIGTQQMPPGQIMIGLALFLTVFVMTPVWSQVNEEALQPLFDKEITEKEALSRAAVPVRAFMLYHTRQKDVMLFLKLAKKPRPNEPEDIPTSVLIPAFMISELKTAFQIGFILYIPFLVLDMVVASTLLSMGMMMLPPMMVSLPLKLMLFVLVDGWGLLVGSLVKSFN
jgi:flagellar biosynthetic protein FliP